ncbi:NAD(P)-dependent alcohol dehydrogenase [Micromonospora yangpuensis]|uniref:NADPH:quinone reductase n=1 Tax=Micromonospora yangpuensis TaxID=683228 RepID=A0A1C6UTV5_9ACTN|nr:NAD(P)-dependent alcohol dehydrogenase [Micromonospora yangpuensis]GGM24648.1 alcohol dehydrogenase [Micromonospora yangpuensis]SCL57418.1 NADPH:quinone reductase [Micromonospora yangpuensis]
MRAAVVVRYGPPEQVVVTDVRTPEPRPGEVLVRVEAAAVTAGDARLRAGRFPAGFGVLARLGVGLRGPRARILGGTLSGRIERVGRDVTRFSPGDLVAGMTGMRLGTHAEYATVRAASLVPKPAGVGHSDAAGVLFGGTTALWFLRERARIRAGHRVLVNGASGAVGSSAVQIAAHLGATVTAVTSARNTAFVTGLGAHRVVDYTTTPVTGLDERFDIVFDAVGNVSRAEGLRLLAPGGSLVLAVANLLDTLRARGPVLAGPARERAEDFGYLLDLVSSGQFAPVTEVVGGLDRLPEAHRRVDTGRKVGNLVITPHSAAG